jgi:hypothetical protein
MSARAVSAASPDGHVLERVVVAGLTTREVLQAVARTVPETGEDLVTRVDIRDGWGGVVHIRVHTLLRRGADEEFARRLRQEVARAVNVRHRVEIVWSSVG